MTNQIANFRQLLLGKSFTTDCPPALLTDLGGVTNGQVQRVRNDEIVPVSERMATIA